MYAELELDDGVEWDLGHLGVHAPEGAGLALERLHVAEQRSLDRGADHRHRVAVRRELGPGERKLYSIMLTELKNHDYARLSLVCKPEARYSTS